MHVRLCAVSLAIIFVGLSSAATPIRCFGENVVYDTCHSHCPLTCDQLKNGIQNNICIAACREGCGCKRGYFINSAGKCVPSTDC
ncbi:hypothetical protein PPYR_05988 [Photinus pyralis]|uniref:TIL domain-containing protein n=1 Tax=Photinus pyralis TaxID=7054 RepID=A0A5N4ASQ1_PHOPY|nr:hypothetical protein PPYR_05988 [Photinus pyralis]